MCKCYGRVSDTFFEPGRGLGPIIAYLRSVDFDGLHSPVPKQGDSFSGSISLSV